MPAAAKRGGVTANRALDRRPPMETIAVMEPSPAQAAGKVTAKTVAAIDVGANALRMVIAEVFSDGRIEVLEQLQRAVRLGQDTFRRGRLGGESMRAAIGVLRDYRQLLDLYKVEKVRAVATSAVREAANGGHVPRPRLHGHAAERRGDRHLGGEPADGLRRAPGGGRRPGRQPAADADCRRGRRQHPADAVGKRRDRHLAKPAARVDPASRDVLHQRGIAAALGRPAAAAHLQRAFHAAELVPLEEIDSFVAVGGDARFAAREIGVPTESADLAVVDPAAFDKLVDRCERHTAEELSKRHGLPFAEAETLNPALLVYQISACTRPRPSKMIVSHVSMRDGLLLELAREVTGKEDEALLTGVIHSATAIAEKYHVDLDHARSVAEVGRPAVRRVPGGPRAGRAASAAAAGGGPVARGGRLRQQPRPPQAQRIPDRQFGDFRAEPQRDRVGLADRPLPSPQRPAGVAPVVHGAAAGVAGGGEQAGGAAARGRRPDPRPSPPAADIRFQRQGDELIVSMPSGATCCWKSGPWKPRAICWRTSTA